MSIVPVESERFTMMEKVADLKMTGKSDTDIAKQLGVKRKDVLTLWEEYRSALSLDREARDMARDHLYLMGEHYDKLIKESYTTLEEVDQLDFNAPVAAQRNATIKVIADLEAKRLDAYQKAGLLDAAEIGDEVAENQRVQEILIDILSNDLCSNCRNHISPKLSRVTGRVDPIDDDTVVDAEVVNG